MEQGDDRQTIRNLWTAEVFGYFTLPDPRRESIEDLGLVTVEYQLSEREHREATTLVRDFGLSPEDAAAALQSLLAIVRHRKAISLPKGVDVDAPAFGPVTAKVAYSRRPTGDKRVHSWIPADKRTNTIIDYLQRLINGNRDSALSVADKLWEVIEPRLIPEKGRDAFVIDHDLLLLRPAKQCYACSRCGTAAVYSARGCCPRPGCSGELQARPFSPAGNIVAGWISDESEHPMFCELRAEEHTAQVKKDLAKIIEDKFRADQGVNLISSTTTFEMGINIGSLQKVLLRNAPPSSANYVQRVGRAGRGSDKNAVCVTMCRRSKYDSDMWREPQRLMAGAVRAPTVFPENKIISQRHFNAVVFAKFLREKLPGTDTAKGSSQTIPLEAFVDPGARRSLPKDYLRHDPPEDTHLNFKAWLEGQDTGCLFNTSTCRDEFERRLGIAPAKDNALIKYKDAMGDAEQELSAMIDARKRAHGRGADEESRDFGEGIKNLLRTDIITFLAESGFLPRYAFPLDVVRLETAKTRWSKESEVELSRSRSIAITEYAPGAQVVARKAVYTSAGVYVLGKRDKPELRWYSKCTCGNIRTNPLRDKLYGGNCDFCGHAITLQRTHRFVSPVAFSIKVDTGPRQRPQRYQIDTLIRQRQGATHFIDQIPDSQFDGGGRFGLAVTENGKLFRYNLGPKNLGFVLCRECGFSEPMFGPKRPRGSHKRPRSAGEPAACKGELVTEVAYANEFESFCFIVRPDRPSVSPESLAHALRKGLCRLLEIESQEIGVALRSRDDHPAEIILYDQTPGGAGFVREGKQKFGEVLRIARQICEDCSCEKACYDCLKDYGNQSLHDKLDRQSVLEFLR
ncbi:MAG: Zn-binding domain-containing protein [Phycisphaerae bacterium]